MIKQLVALGLLLSQVALAGLPPTTSKVSGDSSDITTFKYQFPNFTGTHTGTTISLGVNSIAGGGTGQTTNTAAFDALAPSSPSKGNLLAYDGSHWVKFATCSDTQVLQWDSAQTAGVKCVNATFTAPRAEVDCNTGNGYGSSNTAVRRWTTCTTSGTDITTTDSATLGESFTIATGGDGIYCITAIDRDTVGQAAFRVTKNSTSGSASPTTGLLSNMVQDVNGAWPGTAAWCGKLVAGDVIRETSNLTTNPETSFVMFTITKVSN